MRDPLKGSISVSRLAETHAAHTFSCSNIRLSPLAHYQRPLIATYPRLNTYNHRIIRGTGDSQNLEYRITTSTGNSFRAGDRTIIRCYQKIVLLYDDEERRQANCRNRFGLHSPPLCWLDYCTGANPASPASYAGYDVHTPRTHVHTPMTPTHSWTDHTGRRRGEIGRSK